jgi:hypothetical protein
LKFQQGFPAHCFKRFFPEVHYCYSLALALVDIIWHKLFRGMVRTDLHDKDTKLSGFIARRNLLCGLTSCDFTGSILDRWDPTEGNVWLHVWVKKWLYALCPDIVIHFLQWA